MLHKLKEVLKQQNMITGYLYFYVHFITEVACFFVLSRLIGDSLFLWMAPFVYDAFAFVPQALIGYAGDRFPKINFGVIGVLLLLLGFITFSLDIIPGAYTELIFLCLGNACIHVAGAEATLRTSKGKLSHSAIFVSGGSFGVITGKLLGKTSLTFWIVAILCLTMIPFILLADCYKTECREEDLEKFNYANKDIKPTLVILLAVLIVITRGYMGYGIPTSWNKTITQTILLYVAMGFGKALGGILSDAFGIRKIAVLSIGIALPFLLFGDNIMIISLIGVLLFSMTMSITLALLVSILKKSPGLAFGLTTIGLFLGTAPIFFFTFTTTRANCLVITVLTVLCLAITNKIIIKGDPDG